MPLPALKPRSRNLRSAIGWIPYVLERIDLEWEDQFQDLELKMKPSEYWRRRCYPTYQSDPIGVRLIDVLGEDNVVWGSDFPHPDGVWPDSQESIAREVAPEWTPPSSARCSGRTPPPLRPSPGTRGLRTGPRPRPPTVPHTLRRDERDRPAGRSRPALAIPAAMHDREPPTDSHAPERARVRVQPLPERLRPGANRHAVPRLMQREISARITGYARLHDEGQLRRDEHREQGTPQFKLRLSVIQGAMEPMRAACSRAFRLQSLLVRAHPMD